MKKSNVACVHRRNISRYDSGEQCGPWASCLFCMSEAYIFFKTHSVQVVERMDIFIDLVFCYEVMKLLFQEDL
jgi:hypothetical protein